jgi:uncharacterized protein
MKPMEPFVKKWYDYLETGKIMGTRCKKCGAYEFPPLPVCNTCCSTDLEWVEMDDHGEMIAFSADIIVNPIFEKYGQKLFALVKLSAGPTFVSWLLGTGLDQQEELFKKLPIPVKMEIQKRDKYSYPVFKIVS